MGEVEELLGVEMLEIMEKNNGEKQWSSSSSCLNDIFHATKDNFDCDV